MHFFTKHVVEDDVLFTNHRRASMCNSYTFSIFTILASFVCFFNFPDRNLLILYKITWKLPFRVRQIRCPFSGSTSCTKLLKEQLIFSRSPCFAWLLQGSLPATHFFCFYSCPCFGQTKWCKDPCTAIHLDALSSMPCCLPFTIAYSYAQAPKCFQCLIGIPQYMDHLLNLLVSTCGHFP